MPFVTHSSFALIYTKPELDNTEQQSKINNGASLFRTAHSRFLAGRSCWSISHRAFGEG